MRHFRGQVIKKEDQLNKKAANGCVGWKYVNGKRTGQLLGVLASKISIDSRDRERPSRDREAEGA